MTPNANELCVFAVKRGDIEKRVDVHFYLPQYQKTIQKIKNAREYKKLGELVKFSSDTVDFSKYKYDTFEYLEISGIALGGNYYETKTVKVIQAPSRAKMVVKEDDIVISTTRPNRGAIALIKHNDIIASTGFAIVRDVDVTIDKKWLLYTLLSQCVLQQMLQRSSGGNYPAIIEDEIKNIVIPVVDVQKQKEMVSDFECVLAKYSEDLSSSIVLCKGFTENLAKHLKIEKSKEDRLCYAVMLKDLDGVIDAKRYITIVDKVSKLIISDVCDVVNEKINVLQFGAEMIDWIRIDDLPNSPLDIEEVRTLPANEVEGTFFEVQEGDILVARLGPTILNQKIVRVRSLERKTIASAEFLVLRCREGYNPEAVMSVLKTEYYKDLMYSHARGSTPSRYRLNREDMLKLPFPDIRDRQEQIAAEAIAIRTKVKTMRAQAERELQNARMQFERGLLGE